MVRVVALSLILITSVAANAQGPVKMAILGDSTVTGAATNPHLKPFFANMLGFILNVDLLRPETSSTVADYTSPSEFSLQDPIVRMKRVTYSRREYAEAYQKGYSYLFDLQGGSKLSRAFDWAEQGFGYLISQRLGIKGNEVLLVAQDGKRISSIKEQLERITDTQATLPPFVLISYGLNDICHPDEVNGDVGKFKTEFKATVVEQLRALTAIPPSANGSTVLISAPLDAVNLMDNPELMSQRIPFEGAGMVYGTVSCTELRDKTFKRQSIPGVAMRNLLIQECKGLRSDTDKLPERITKVRALQNAQIEAWKEAIADLKTPGFKWLFGESIRSVQFTSGDLANDCFHPSRSAHAKIARQFLANELKDLDKSFQSP